MEQYPLWIVAASNLVSLSIYALGAFLLYLASPYLALVYVAYCLFLEVRLLSKSCVDCYYYGKTCGFGKGRICSVFFRKGDSSRFPEKKICWTDMLPDLMVSLVPLLAAAYLLVTSFSWTVAFAAALILILSSAGTGFVRAQLVCPRCKQRELGCPAERLFAKK